ncbi:MAG: heavy metal translocating P-type ATPase [Rhodocyclaceae bacterium]|nr:MAG: heavy metal translocating P-type ATPase [Rhodocyclaceae bacterium]
MGEACYHCGLPIPATTDFPAVIDGESRRMCCAGCQAVAQAIVANGLADYYRHREALPESPRQALPGAMLDAGAFDLPEVQKNFVERVQGEAGEHQREASLILEGITCAACVWLNEQHLARQPGVIAVSVNYSTGRARVRWDQRRIKLSQILLAIAAIGYRAHPYDPARSEQLAGSERRAAQWRLFVAGFGMMQVMMYAVPVYLADGEMTPDIEQLMRWASLILTLPVMLYSAAPFFKNAWRDLRLARVGMDVPVALGVGVAFLASGWATLTASGAVYFDSVTMFIFFLLGGRYFEMMGRQKAVRGIETLSRVMPAFAARLSGFPALDSERVAVAQLAVGDMVLVKPGEVIPADGEVVQGESAADESLLTGESAAVAKSASDSVTGGSINVGSPLVVRILKVGADTRVATIRRLIERAAAEKPRLVELADRIASRFVGILLILAATTGVVWYAIDPQRALWVFVAVLVVSCPCALSLATPTVLTVASGALARLGVLVTRNQAIEVLARADHFVFDKTGTLTLGTLTLDETLLLGALSDAAALALAASLEQGSEHPIGRALCASSARNPMTGAAPLAEELHAVTGRGVEARLGSDLVRIGTADFAGALHGTPLPAHALHWSESGGSVVALANAQGWLALFRFRDRLRPNAAAMLAELRRSGARLTLLSGDTAPAVAEVARQLGISDARSGHTPEAKHAFLAELQAGGAVVAMVGDGVNDAPVLAQAQVSIAMGGGSDLARQQADIVLLAGELMPLAHGVKLARKALRVMRENLAWAFAYNLLAIPLAMLGVITPWMAGIGMSASSLLVVLNALRLQGRQGPTDRIEAQP